MEAKIFSAADLLELTSNFRDAVAPLYPVGSTVFVRINLGKSVQEINNAINSGTRVAATVLEVITSGVFVRVNYKVIESGYESSVMAHIYPAVAMIQVLKDLNLLTPEQHQEREHILKTMMERVVPVKGYQLHVNEYDLFSLTTADHQTGYVVTYKQDGTLLLDRRTLTGYQQWERQELHLAVDAEDLADFILV